MSRRRDNPYVTLETCVANTKAINDKIDDVSTEVKTIKKALIGEDMQGGLVAEVKDIKSKLAMAKELRDWIRPLLLAALASLLTAGLLKLFHV